MNKLFKLFVIIACCSAYGDVHFWNASVSGGQFNVGSNWSPVCQVFNSTMSGDFRISNLSENGESVVSSDINISSSLINITGGSSDPGVLSIRSGELKCRRLQAGMLSGSGIVNIYGGSVIISGDSNNITTTGSLSAYNGGIINLYGGTIVMDYGLRLANKTKLVFHNVGAYEAAEGALHAPIYIKRTAPETDPVHIGGGVLEFHLAQNLNLASGDIIYLIEYDGNPESLTFTKLLNGDIINIDGFNFTFVTNQVCGTRYAVALIARQSVDTRLLRGTAVMISMIDNIAK